MSSNTLRNFLLLLAVFVLGSALLAIGFVVGRFTLSQFTGWPNWMMGFSQNRQIEMGPGMMNEYYDSTPGDTSQAYPYNQGMMGSFGSSGLASTSPLSISQAESAVQGYIDTLGNADLEITEIMIFDNQAYAEIGEKSTGVGAMEVLVDPASREVYPEPGPNMMWNLKYGMMSGYPNHPAMGGMMGGWAAPEATPPDVDAAMPVNPEQAVQIAQQYLDQNLPGAQANQEADAFYGYYTLHVLRDGQVNGMLGVNGYNGQVFPHTWHGKFIEMSEEGN